jgi:hypothetical protein
MLATAACWLLQTVMYADNWLGEETLLLCDCVQTSTQQQQVGGSPFTCLSWQHAAPTRYEKTSQVKFMPQIEWLC